MLLSFLTSADRKVPAPQLLHYLLILALDMARVEVPEGQGLPLKRRFYSVSGLKTRRKPRPAKSLTLTVANSRTPDATRERPRRAS